jgi:hypothetical protein
VAPRFCLHDAEKRKILPPQGHEACNVVTCKSQSVCDPQRPKAPNCFTVQHLLPYTSKVKECTHIYNCTEATTRHPMNYRNDGGRKFPSSVQCLILLQSPLAYGNRLKTHVASELSRDHICLHFEGNTENRSCGTNRYCHHMGHLLWFQYGPTHRAVSCNIDALGFYTVAGYES